MQLTNTNFFYIAIITLFFAKNIYADDIRFGVIAPRGAAEAQEMWSQMAKYLGKETGKNVVIYPVTPDKVEESVASGGVQYMLGNPVTTVILEEKHKARPLVTVNGPGGTKFAGVIFSKKGSKVEKAEDLKGKNVMAFKFEKSAAAYVFQVFHLRQKGIDPHKDFASFREAKKQDDIVLAVKSGVIDAGFIASGILEQMQSEGKINIAEDFHIIDAQKGDIANIHSTKTYPEWYLVATHQANVDDSTKIRTALLKLKENDIATKNARIKGFVEPLNLDGLKETLRALKLSPYKS